MFIPIKYLLLLCFLSGFAFACLIIILVEFLTNAFKSCK